MMRNAEVVESCGSDGDTCELPDLDIEITGFEGEEIEQLLDELLVDGADGGNDDDFDLEAALDESRSPITQPEDLIELGRHRLLCGDATDPLKVRELMQGKRATLFATDPPYLVNYDNTNHPGKSRSAERKKNKNWSGTYAITWDDADAQPDLYEKFIKTAVDEAIEQSAAWYCWHASRRQAMVESVWHQFGAFAH